MTDYRLVKSDCFSFRQGKQHPECNALNDMICKYKSCPFHKTTWQYNHDLKKYQNRQTMSDNELRKKPKKEEFDI